MSFTNYQCLDQFIPRVPFEVVGTEALYNLERRVNVVDSTYGVAELVYLECNSATVLAGQAGTYRGAGSFNLSFSDQPGSLVIALSDITAGSYGWFLKRGVIPVTATDFDGSGNSVYVDASSAGLLSSDDSVGPLVYKARAYTTSGTPSTGYTEIFLDDCFVIE